MREIKKECNNDEGNNNDEGDNNEGDNNEGNNNEGNNNEGNNNEEEEEEAETKLSEPIKKGATVVQVETEADVKVGAKVVIDAGTKIEEENEIKSFGSLVLMKPLKFAHPAGAKVTIMSSSGGSRRRRRRSGGNNEGG